MTSSVQTSAAPSGMTPSASAMHKNTENPALPEQATQAESAYQPYVAPERASIFSLQLADLAPTDPVTWLRKGWQDFSLHPKPGLFYGFAFFAMGHALWAVFKTAPAYVMALSAGFLLMGPFLCLGLYHVSRAIERGERPSLGASLLIWTPTKGAMGIFAGVLLILEMLWGRASLIVFAVTFSTVPSADNTLAQLLDPENIGFLFTYVAVGGVFAGLIFVSSVIAIPMIMDRQVDAVSAGLTSIRACIQNPGVMLLWGALITTVIGLSMLPYFLGLLVAGPVVGHATWHAYRAIVPASNSGFTQ